MAGIQTQYEALGTRISPGLWRKEKAIGASRMPLETRLVAFPRGSSGRRCGGVRTAYGAGQGIRWAPGPPRCAER